MTKIPLIKRLQFGSQESIGIPSLLWLLTPIDHELTIYRLLDWTQTIQLSSVATQTKRIIMTCTEIITVIVYLTQKHYLNKYRMLYSHRSSYKPVMRFKEFLVHVGSIVLNIFYICTTPVHLLAKLHINIVHLSDLTICIVIVNIFYSYLLAHTTIIYNYFACGQSN